MNKGLETLIVSIPLLSGQSVMIKWFIRFKRDLEVSIPLLSGQSVIVSLKINKGVNWFQSPYYRVNL